MMRVPVFVSGWQIECCWEQPAVGQMRDWYLWFRHDAEMQSWDPATSLGHLTVTAEAVPYSTHDSPVQGPHAVVLHLGGLAMHWDPPQHVPRGPVPVSGWVLHEGHGGVPDALPCTRAEILEVHVENREYVQETPGSSAWTYSDSPPRYRRVDLSPKWFANTDLPNGRRDLETGVVVVIDSKTPGQVAGTRLQ